MSHSLSWPRIISSQARHIRSLRGLQVSLEELDVCLFALRRAPDDLAAQRSFRGLRSYGHIAATTLQRTVR